MLLLRGVQCAKLSRKRNVRPKAMVQVAGLRRCDPGVGAGNGACRRSVAHHEGSRRPGCCHSTGTAPMSAAMSASPADASKHADGIPAGRIERALRPRLRWSPSRLQPHSEFRSAGRRRSRHDLHQSPASEPGDRHARKFGHDHHRDVGLSRHRPRPHRLRVRPLHDLRHRRLRLFAGAHRREPRQPWPRGRQAVDAARRLGRGRRRRARAQSILERAGRLSLSSVWADLADHAVGAQLRVDVRHAHAARGLGPQAQAVRRCSARKSATTKDQASAIGMCTGR